MLIRYLPLVAGVLPIAAAYLAFWIGVEAGSLPACIPFVDGCASISATGRRPPGSFLFRAVMLPHAAVLLATWYFTVAWLRCLDPGLRRGTARAIHVTGATSAVALILYVTFLGTREPFYEFMRRFGIYFFFIGMVVAEVLVTDALYRMAALRRRPELAALFGMLLVLCVVPFALGVLNFILKATLEDASGSENVIEWLVATIMHAWLIVLYLLWRRTGFEISARANLQ
ncbi:MAG: hypothetical protein R3176_03550 [Woeseiaceae bacterium]|nr:hypothetical protein [Woeseiaceae bacterium]